MASLRTGVIFCCILIFLSRGESSQTEKCLTQQRNPRHIELCHDQTGFHGEPFKCKSPNDGFVLAGLNIAPRSKHNDCGDFHSLDYLDSNCLRKVVDNVDQFDAGVFDVLEKVSGKNELDRNTVVSRISWSEKEGEAGEEKQEDSSAFVSFSNLCKPARPVQTSDNQVARMCRANKVVNSIAILTFQGLDPGHVPEGLSRCRCTVIPSHSVRIQAFDIRLQHNRTCSPGVSLKMYAGGQPLHNLGCQGLSAHYGLEEMVRIDKEVTLDLTVASGAFPDSVWLQLSSMKEGSSSSDPMILRCEGIVPLNKLTGDGTDLPNQDDDSGANIGLIVGIVVGVLALIVVIVIAFVLIRKRKQRSSKTNNDMNSSEYAEIPENPRDPSTYTPSEKSAPALPPNHPCLQSKSKPVSNALKSLQSEKKSPSSSATNANNTQAKANPVNPVSKPQRSFAPELKSWKTSLKEKKASSVNDEEYNHLMRSGGDAERNSTMGGGRRGSDKGSQNRYHHLELGKNGAEIHPQQPPSQTE